MPNSSWLCVTCCSEFPPSKAPPDCCPICSDPRQYVGENGQQWVRTADLAKDHASEVREEEPGLLGIGVSPKAGIGQRALLVTHPEGGVLFDGVPLIDDEALAAINKAGGVRAMVMSHPHLYGAMVTNSIKLGNVPIHIPEADRKWVMYPHENVRFFSGDHLDLGHGARLEVVGGHFEGSAFLHWRDGAGGKGALLTGDTMLVAEDKQHVSFMWSAPNRVQLGPRAIRRIVARAHRLPYDRIYAGWWGSVLADGARRKVDLSEKRLADIQKQG